MTVTSGKSKVLAFSPLHCKRMQAQTNQMPSIHIQKPNTRYIGQAVKCFQPSACNVARWAHDKATVFPSGFVDAQKQKKQRG